MKFFCLLNRKMGAQISSFEVSRLELDNDDDTLIDNSGIQSTGYYEISTVSGAFLTGDSNLPVDLLEDVPANIDNISKFMTEQQAALQPKPQKSVE